MMLPKVYMIELKPESGAVYIEEHDMWVSDNSRFLRFYGMAGYNNWNLD